MTIGASIGPNMFYFSQFLFQEKIERKFECNLLVSCSNHIILCQVGNVKVDFTTMFSFVEHKNQGRVGVGPRGVIR